MSKIKNGDAIVFRHKEAKAGIAFGEARVCNHCGIIQQINAVLISHEEDPTALRGKLVDSYVAEYNPEINEDGECICEVCGKVQD